jgi:hypothetical protein
VRLAGGLAVVACITFVSAARGDASTQDQALAEALFREGKRLVSSGSIPEACAKFAESQRLDPRTGTLLYLATCHEQQGKTASAWAEYNEVAEQSSHQKQSDRAALARGRLVALEPKLSRLVVKAPATRGVSITLDGHALNPAALGTPLPVDPGTHTIAAAAPGKKAWTVGVEIAPGSSTSEVGVPPLDDEAAPVVTPAPAPAQQSTPHADDAPTTDGSSARTIGMVVGGAGVVALGIGSYFGLHAAAQRRDADTMCVGTACTQAGLDEHANSRTSALVSTVAFAIGIPAVVAGAWLFFTSPRPGARTATTRIAPAIAPGSARLVAETRW